MNRLREIFSGDGKNRPLDSDSFIVGLFQIVFGIWLISPGVSFGFVILAQADPALAEFLSPTSETLLGLMVVGLGIIDCFGVYFERYVLLKNMDIIGAAYWAFITVSWILTDPHSTAVIVYGFFTLYSVYQFHAWSSYTHSLDLRNKRNVGNI